MSQSKKGVLTSAQKFQQKLFVGVIGIHSGRPWPSPCGRALRAREKIPSWYFFEPPSWVHFLRKNNKAEVRESAFGFLMVGVIGIEPTTLPV